VTDGVRAFVDGTRYRPQMGFWRRLAAFARFTLFATAFVLRRGRRYGVVVASSGPLSIACPARLARRLYGVPYVFEAIDVWPDAAIAAGVLRNPLLQRLAFGIERRAYRDAARIVTCSDGMEQRIVGKGVPPDKVVTIPNCAVASAFDAGRLRRTETRRELGLTEGQIAVLYLGAMGRSNAIDDVCTAVRATSDDERIRWWFAGDGPEAGRLRALAGETGGRFLGRLPRERAAEVCAAADVGVVTFLHAPLFRENSPNKFFDYIAAGLAVLFNRGTWLEPAIEAYGNGYVCKSGDPGPEMAAWLRNVANDPQRLESMRLASRRMAAERFDHGRMTESYLQILAAAGG
jgi:glycosyltransferase involved in cell wall biosynthesis